LRLGRIFAKAAAGSGSGCNYQGPGTGVSAWAQINGLESQGMSYAEAIGSMTGDPFCRIFPAAGSTASKGGQKYMWAWAFVSCSGRVKSISISRYAQNCSFAVFGHCVDWAWHTKGLIDPSCNEESSGRLAGNTYYCPSTVPQSFYYPIDNGQWRAEVEVDVTFQDGSTWSGDAFADATF
jgi:hypothetical protein